MIEIKDDKEVKICIEKEELIESIALMEALMEYLKSLDERHGIGESHPLSDAVTCAVEVMQAFYLTYFGDDDNDENM